MDDRLVAGIAALTVVLFGAFLLVDDHGLRARLLLAGTTVIAVTAAVFIVQLGRRTWRSFEDA